MEEKVYMGLHRTFKGCSRGITEEPVRVLDLTLFLWAYKNFCMQITANMLMDVGPPNSGSSNW